MADGNGAKPTKAQREAAEKEQRERADEQLADIRAFEEQEGRPPTKDELAERRSARATADGDRALEAEMGGHTGEGDGNGSGSIEGGELAPGTAEADDGQIFVWEQGRKVSLGTLIPRGVDVTHHFVFQGKRVKAKGELQALDSKSLLLVQGISGGTRAIPTHDSDDRVESVAVESIVQTKTITAIESQPVEAIAMLRPILDRLGYDVVERPAQATG